MFFQLTKIEPSQEQYATEAPVVITATTTATDLIPANASRIGLGFVNETNASIYLNAGEAATAPASASVKIFVIPAQSYVSFDNREETPTEALNVVWGETATGNLTAIERVVVQ